MSGERAFPLTHISGTWWNEGMLLRDWFAGQALIMLKRQPAADLSTVAVEAYMIADAMMKVRKQETT